MIKTFSTAEEADWHDTPAAIDFHLTDIPLFGDAQLRLDDDHRTLRWTSRTGEAKSVRLFSWCSLVKASSLFGTDAHGVQVPVELHDSPCGSVLPSPNGCRDDRWWDLPSSMHFDQTSSRLLDGVCRACGHVRPCCSLSPSLSTLHPDVERAEQEERLIHNRSEWLWLLPDQSVELHGDFVSHSVR